MDNHDSNIEIYTAIGDGGGGGGGMPLYWMVFVLIALSLIAFAKSIM